LKGKPRKGKGKGKFSSGKGKGRRMNPKGPDGQIMKCRKCGSIEHLQKDCPRNQGGTRPNVGGNPGNPSYFVEDEHAPMNTSGPLNLPSMSSHPRIVEIVGTQEIPVRPTRRVQFTFFNENSSEQDETYVHRFFMTNDDSPRNPDNPRERVLPGTPDGSQDSLWLGQFRPSMFQFAQQLPVPQEPLFASDSQYPEPVRPRITRVEHETPLFSREQNAELERIMTVPKGSALEPTYVPQTAASSSQGPMMFTNSSYVFPQWIMFSNASAANGNPLWNPQAEKQVDRLPALYRMDSDQAEPIHKQVIQDFAIRRVTSQVPVDTPELYSNDSAMTQEPDKKFRDEF
jgi:hypothetical protein